MPPRYWVHEINVVPYVDGVDGAVHILNGAAW